MAPDIAMITMKNGADAKGSVGVGGHRPPLQDSMSGMMRRAIASVLIGGLLTAMARGEIWRTTEGEAWEGSLRGVYGAVAVFAEGSGVREAPLQMLDEASLVQVAEALAQRMDPAWSASESAMAKALRKRLQVLAAGDLMPFELGTKAEPEIYLIYFAAQWWGPCLALTPVLAKEYENLKRLAGDRIELVFVSDDPNAREQLEFARRTAMPWPMLTFSTVRAVPLIERWKGRDIPCLVALTREGELMYRGDPDDGPRRVLMQVGRLVAGMRAQSVQVKRARHRLAVLQHVRAAAGGSAKPKPYVVALDDTRRRALPVKQLVATIDLDEQGRVASVAFEPKLETGVEYQLIQDAETWLFLPAVEDGRAIAQRVQLPLEL